MLKDFAGTTLVDILLSKLIKSKEITPDQIYFCVGEDELIEAGSKYPINIVRRSQASLNEEMSVTVFIILIFFRYHFSVCWGHSVYLKC